MGIKKKRERGGGGYLVILYAYNTHGAVLKKILLERKKKATRLNSHVLPCDSSFHFGRNKMDFCFLKKWHLISRLST